jgi:hypothetical protein
VCVAAVAKFVSLCAAAAIDADAPTAALLRASVSAAAVAVPYGCGDGGDITLC